MTLPIGRREERLAATTDAVSERGHF